MTFFSLHYDLLKCCRAKGEKKWSKTNPPPNRAPSYRFGVFFVFRRTTLRSCMHRRTHAHKYMKCIWYGGGGGIHESDINLYRGYVCAALSVCRAAAVCVWRVLISTAAACVISETGGLRTHVRAERLSRRHTYYTYIRARWNDASARTTATRRA